MVKLGDQQVVHAIIVEKNNVKHAIFMSLRYERQ